MADSIPSQDQIRFAIVGGGISGLTAAYRLMKLQPGASVELFEASPNLGGVLQTHSSGELLIEQGADSFFNKLPWASELCEELGLADELIPTNSGERRAFVVRSGKLHPVPTGFVVIRPLKIGPMLRTPLLSWSAKIRLLCERWVPPTPDIERHDFDESVASFATRRLGKETFQQLVQPLLAGIYTADPAKLSLAATMPETIQEVRQFGSLYQASLAKRKDPEALASGARYARFVTLRGGLGKLIEKLASHLSEGSIHCSTPINRLQQDSSSEWLLSTRDGTQYGPYQGVVVGLPAPRAAELLANTDSHLQQLMQRITYASSAVVSLAFSSSQLREKASGFGFVVPTVENRRIVAASFSSKKFRGRAPEDQFLVRVFLGGALQPEILQLQDDQIVELARSELSELLNIQGIPLHTDLVRWQEKMPQYHVGHVQLVAEIEQQVEKLAGLELAGNAYHGVGIPQCVDSGNKAARRMADYCTKLNH